MAPSISVRESIRWLPDAASESANTLVLTSNEKRFVDIRILKAAGPGTLNSDVLHPRHIDWAFAGVSSSELQKRPNGNSVVHSTWRHWVDSRTLDAETVVDEGDMVSLEDGRTLETGKMANPATGRMTEYEEVWRDVEPLSTGGEVRTERNQSGSEGEKRKAKRRCAVLVLDDPKHKARGMVVRVGQYCQGVLRVGGTFNLEQWEWHSVEEGWKRKVRIGDLFVPCGPLLDGERLRLGGELRHGDFVWTLVELSDF